MRIIALIATLRLRLNLGVGNLEYDGSNPHSLPNNQLSITASVHFILPQTTNILIWYKGFQSIRLLCHVTKTAHCQRASESVLVVTLQVYARDNQ